MKVCNLEGILFFVLVSFLSFQPSISKPPVLKTNAPVVRPLNIILFTADDLDRNSLGCYGSEVPDITPHIDRFASQSMRFQRAFVNSAICVPSRAIIATGLYGNRSGVNGFKKMQQGSTAPLLMEILRAHNYEVGILGKVNHSTPKAEFQWDYHFDQQDLGWGRNPNLYFEKTKAFLDQCEKKNKPFYLMINSHDPHRPFYNPGETPEDLSRKMNQPIERIEGLMKNVEKPGRIYLPEEITVPGFLPDLPLIREELSYYYNSTRRMDDVFGKVLQALEESGMSSNTIVIFIGDNGMAVPFAKANVYYASNLTPLIIRWPGTIQPGKVNTSEIVSTIDFMPTIFEALQIPVIAPMDGYSFMPLLKGKKQSGRDKTFLEIDYKQSGGVTPMRSVVTKQFSYIYNAWADGEREYANNNEGSIMKAMEEAAVNNAEIKRRVHDYRLRTPEELYDIIRDPDSKHNLIHDPAFRTELDLLRKAMEDWMIRIEDPLLKVYQKRNDPVQALIEFYNLFPETKALDKNKKAYSKAKASGE